MQGFRPKLISTVVFTVLLAFCRDGDARQPLQRHWKETSSETLWTGRYNNCDYGYYVSLPSGVVAHNPLPPSPNHGFLVALPDFGSMNYALDRKERFIWVDASYSDASSLSDLVHERDSGETRPSQIPMKMGGLSAVQIRATHDVGASSVVEVTTVSLRAGITYTIGIRTNGTHAMEDQSLYRRLVLGFKLLPLPWVQCSNG